MANSSYNSSPMISPIARTTKRLENASMTNLLTPTRSNKSLLSSTRITPQRTTPRYALSKPMHGIICSPRSPLTSTQFNSNSTFYSPSRVSKSPENAAIRDPTPTHQAKYGRAGLFPVVHFFQKKVPVITPKQNRCVIKLSSNGPGLFDDAADNAYEAQNVVNTSQAAESSTRSVLDALKEISRKRIHDSESYDKEKERTSEYSKRNREEDTSLSPKSATAGPQQAPKKICVVDPIYASNTSSFCLKNNKRKLYECWLPTNDTKSKKVMTTETQTQTQPTEEAKTKSVAVQNEVASEPSSETSAKLENVEAKADTPKELDRDEDTAASAQRAWDEKIYAIQKKNKLAIVLSRITGEEPKLIPVPRLWDKTSDVPDSAPPPKSVADAASSSGGAVPNGLSTFAPKAIEYSIASSSSNISSASSSAASSLNFGFGVKNPIAPTTTTASVALPIISSSLSGIEAPSKDGKAAASPLASSTSSLSVSVGAASRTTSSTTSSTASTPSFDCGAKPVGMFGGTPAVSSATVSPAVGNGFALGSGCTAPATVTTAAASNLGIDSAVKIAPAAVVPAFGTLTSVAPTTANLVAGGFKFGGASQTTPTLPAFGSPITTATAGISTPAANFTLTGAGTTSTATTSTANALTSSTLKASVFTASSDPAKSIFGSTANGVVPASTNSSANVAIAFGATVPPAFESKTEPESFAPAFGPHNARTGTTASSTLITPSAVASTAAGGFSFKPSEGGKSLPPPSAAIFDGVSSVVATTTTGATSAGGFLTSALFGGGKTEASTAVFGSGGATTAFGGALGGAASTQAQATSALLALCTTSVKNTAFGNGGAFPAATTTAAPALSKSIGGAPLFGGPASSTAGTFGAAQVAASSGNTTVGSTPSFGAGAGFAAPASAFSPTANSVSAFGNALPKPAFGSSSTTSAGGNAGGFSFGASSPPPPFGATSTSTTASSLGGNAGSGGFAFGSSNSVASGAGGFGSSTSAFGSPAPAFGGGAGSAFGSTTTTTSALSFAGYTKPGTTTGIATNSNASGFGFNSPDGCAGTSAPTSAFGQGSSGGSAVFSFGSNSAPTTTSAFAFGAAPTATTTPSFGASLGFGSTGNAFGSTATTQATGFGGAPNVNPFGKSTTSTFGAPAASNTSAFGAATSPAPPAFGAASTAPPTFGAASPPANPSAFGTAFGQPQQSGQSTFNSSFGGAAAPAAGGNSTFTFGSSNTTSGFGGSQTLPAFGAVPPSTSFTFKAPTAGADAAKGVFAFGGADLPKPAAGGFNFSAGGVSPAPAPNFGAAFGANPAQQPGMFSIGSGASSNKRVQLRAKRRT